MSRRSLRYRVCTSVLSAFIAIPATTGAGLRIPVDAGFSVAYAGTDGSLSVGAVIESGPGRMLRVGADIRDSTRFHGSLSFAGTSWSLFAGSAAVAAGAMHRFASPFTVRTGGVDGRLFMPSTAATAPVVAGASLGGFGVYAVVADSAQVPYRTLCAAASLKGNLVDAYALVAASERERRIPGGSWYVGQETDPGGSMLWSGVRIERSSKPGFVAFQASASAGGRTVPGCIFRVEVKRQQPKVSFAGCASLATAGYRSQFGILPDELAMLHASVQWSPARFPGVAASLWQVLRRSAVVPYRGNAAASAPYAGWAFSIPGIHGYPDSRLKLGFEFRTSTGTGRKTGGLRVDGSLDLPADGSPKAVLGASWNHSWNGSFELSAAAGANARASLRRDEGSPGLERMRFSSRIAAAGGHAGSGSPGIRGSAALVLGAELPVRDGAMAAPSVMADLRLRLRTRTGMYLDVTLGTIAAESGNESEEPDSVPMPFSISFRLGRAIDARDD